MVLVLLVSVVFLRHVHREHQKRETVSLQWEIMVSPFPGQINKHILFCQPVPPHLSSYHYALQSQGLADTASLYPICHDEQFDNATTCLLYTSDAADER